MGIEPDNREDSLRLLKKYAGEFYARKSETSSLLCGIARVVVQWRGVAGRLGIPGCEQVALSSAFEHENGYAAVLTS